MDQTIYKALADYCGDSSLEIVLGHLDTTSIATLSAWSSTRQFFGFAE